MDWKKGTPLGPDQTGHPIIWHDRWPGHIEWVPKDLAWFLELWRDGKATKRVGIFGHLDRTNRHSPHYLATRGGTTMHTDPAGGRYSLQLQLSNPGGFVVHGLEDDLSTMPFFTPGLVNILDTHSPHKVSRDPRLPSLNQSKLLICSDHHDVPDPNEALPPLIAHLRATYPSL